MNITQSSGRHGQSYVRINCTFFLNKRAQVFEVVHVFLTPFSWYNARIVNGLSEFLLAQLTLVKRRKRQGQVYDQGEHFLNSLRFLKVF